ncbi:2Fe-2S iron-sulfur cluster-binding protein [Leptothoe sp. PORK10 BA2]|uniref:2Fe-2S iron-sulfur cluster-binding protein n=1 Tax=Leptothoe sp. PORK10 BA2 TaxID=3110254 RepID=UPI002B21FA1A|nr:2Fe-2S iron-sulfur cluster-binding protein [Leptothoe sp. PORK10 BA2]MEA5465955.1 2Fe-2S iron-sulfur cluster-binding protein [Leptothoe sp. PORK10 BA2]
MATYSVEINHQGTVQTITVDGSQTILEAGHAAGIDLPTSCGAGVCTTCAALVTEGSVSQEDGMGVSQELQDKGYALLCVAYATSDLKIVTEKEDEVYQAQFGQFQG